MRRFEYCYIKGVNDNSLITKCGRLVCSNGKMIDVKRTHLADFLNDLGKDGWEIVGCGCSYNGHRHNIYLKREVEG